jgi:hypothetical protein
MAADDPLVQKALDRIASLTDQINRAKRFVNEADRFNDLPPRFPEADDGGVGDLQVSGDNRPRPARRWQPGDFFGSPLAAAVRRILEARAAANGGKPQPTSIDDIHVALSEGSFAFEGSGADAQKNGIRISLGKNSPVFVRLPNSDLFGLVEWYGARARKPGKKATSSVTGNGGEAAAGDTAAEDQPQEDVQEGQEQP